MNESSSSSVSSSDLPQSELVEIRVIHDQLREKFPRWRDIKDPERMAAMDGALIALEKRIHDFINRHHVEFEETARREGYRGQHKKDE